MDMLIAFLVIILWIIRLVRFWRVRVSMRISQHFVLNDRHVWVRPLFPSWIIKELRVLMPNRLVLTCADRDVPHAFIGSRLIWGRFSGCSLNSCCWWTVIAFKCLTVLRCCQWSVNLSWRNHRQILILPPRKEPLLAAWLVVKSSIEVIIHYRHCHFLRLGSLFNEKRLLFLVDVPHGLPHILSTRL